MSTIADTSSVFYRGRARSIDSLHIPLMIDADWRGRLQEAIDAKGMTARSVSLAAKLSPGYVHSIIQDGKEPSISRLIAIADILGVSLSYLVYGVQMTAEEEDLLLTYARLSRRQREDFLRLAKSTASVDTEA